MAGWALCDSNTVQPFLSQMSSRAPYSPACYYLISLCYDRFEAMPPFLQKSIAMMFDIITDTFTPQAGRVIFQNFQAHLLEFASSLESSPDWKPSSGARAWESELNKVPELKQIYTNMIDLIMESADSQDCVLEWLLDCVGIFQDISPKNSGPTKKS